MSLELINRSPDLKRLLDEGYEIEVKEGYAFLHHIPYVNPKCEIKYGSLVCALTLAGDVTTRPNTHVIEFVGEHPCNKDGSIIFGIQHAEINRQLPGGFVAKYSFSNKPANGYNDFYEKFTRYAEIVVAQARAIDETVTAKTFNVIAATDQSVFNFHDTNSSRANITEINQRVEKQRVGIIGLGGTGAYILDLVSKTPVGEIHLYDGDEFLQHNAFRAPGAPKVEELQAKQKKTNYFQNKYSNMRTGIYAHTDYIDESNVQDLISLDFVFISMDEGSTKKGIVSRLTEERIPFVDVGIGVQVVDKSLIGILRTTTVTPEKNDHVPFRIPFASGIEDEYSTNIQIAELNALNAAFAVIKWKKLFGFYQYINKEHHMTYTINTGDVTYDD